MGTRDGGDRSAGKVLGGAAWEALYPEGEEGSTSKLCSRQQFLAGEPGPRHSLDEPGREELFTTLQAVGRTRQYFEIALANTLVYIGLVVVGVKFFQIGTLAGALGRAFLAILIVLLARRSPHHTISAHTTAAMGRTILLALGSGLPLLLLDQFFLRVDSFGLQPVFQLAILAGLFVVAFAFVSRHLRVFNHGDLAIIRDALPRRLQLYLKIVQRLIIKENQ